MRSLQWCIDGGKAQGELRDNIWFGGLDLDQRRLGSHAEDFNSDASAVFLSLGRVDWECNLWLIIKRVWEVYWVCSLIAELDDTVMRREKGWNLCFPTSPHFSASGIITRSASLRSSSPWSCWAGISLLRVPQGACSRPLIEGLSVSDLKGFESRGWYYYALPCVVPVSALAEALH